MRHCLSDREVGAWRSVRVEGEDAGMFQQNPQMSTVSWRDAEIAYLSDKYSLRVITLFQPRNDINKPGIQGITQVRTNN